MPLEPRVRNLGSTGFHVAPTSAYKDEAELEDLVRKQPEVLLPWATFGDQALPPIVIGRQTELPSAGVADLIAVSEDGYITVVEVKLNKNAEARRTVVGQVLSYAAYLRGLTIQEFERVVCRPYFDGQLGVGLGLANLSLASAVAVLRARQRQEAGLLDSEGDWLEREFTSRLEANLTAGRMRLLIVVDRINDDLRRIVEFLSEATSGRVQVLAYGLSPFASTELQVLMPELAGARPSGPQTTAEIAGNLDEESYRRQVRNREGGIRLLDRLLALVRQRAEVGDYLRWNRTNVAYRAQLPPGETTVLWAELTELVIPLGLLSDISAENGAGLRSKLSSIESVAKILARGKREVWIVYSKTEFTSGDADAVISAIAAYLAASS